MAWEHDCLGQAKGAAYSTILFFFPLILFIVALLVLADLFPLVMRPLVDILPQVLPPESRALVMTYIEETSRLDPTKLILFSFVAMLWTGWGLMSSFIEGVNRAFGEHEEHSLLLNQWAALKLLGFVAAPLLILSLGAIIQERGEDWLGIHGRVLTPFLARALRWITVVGTMIAMNAIVYWAGVHRRQTLRQVLPGALLATGIWVTSTLLFTTYVGAFGRYNVIYGSLGAAIILLVWMYLGCLAVLLGGEFNAVLARASSGTKPQ